MSKWLKQCGRVTATLLCLVSSLAMADANVPVSQVGGGGAGGTIAGSSSGTPIDVLFQDLKSFLASTNAANMQAANILLYMLPPFYDITLAVTSRMGEGESTKEQWQGQKLRDLATYNTMTQLKSDIELLADRVSFCVDAQGKPTKFCDYLNQDSGNDVLASALLETAAYETDAERKAAMQYIRNLTNYSPPEYPGDVKVFQDPNHKEKGLTTAGIAYFAKVYKTQATLTMAQNALLSIFSDRTRFDNFSQGLPVGENGKASVLEMMHYDVNRRYMNQNWYDLMTKSSDSAVLREIANMLALQNYLQVKEYKQNAQIIGLLAASLSATNKNALDASAAQNNPKIQSAMDKISND